MDANAVESFRRTVEQTVRDLADERGNLTFFQRYVPFQRPRNMPANIVTQHMAGAFAGLLAQPVEAQHAAIRRRFTELIDDLIGGRTKKAFLLEERPVEFWQEGTHLHYCWRCGCAEEYEEQTEEQWMHAPSPPRR